MGWTDQGGVHVEEDQGERPISHKDRSARCVVDVGCVDGYGMWRVCVLWMGQDGMGNNIGDIGAEHIARALEKNTTITTIYLSSV